MKTSELTGEALDWAVAKCEGEDYRPVITYSGIGQEFPPTNYSTDWSQGGPIIEHEGITVSEGSPVIGLEWMACDRGSTHIQHGPTYLIAAMRCYVASKLGDEVEIMEDLTK